MSAPAFSVIIPAYKMGRFIGEALSSVGAQSCRDWEVIVVEDCGPEDGTEAIVRDFAKAHPNHRVEFIRHEKNTGVSGARNTAIAAARAAWIAFLDPDDLWMPVYLTKMVEIMSGNTDTCAISSPVEAFYETAGGEFIDPLRFEGWQINRFPASLAIGNFLQPSSTVVRRSVMNEVGGFDTDPDMQHIEDYDLWIRLAQRGHKFSFINENLTRYRKHPAAATSNTPRMAELHEHLARKHSAFFISSQSQFIRLLLAENTRMKRNLKNPVGTILRRLFGK
jgi:glycosyltransferase involved in cell wall biosynthesis